MCRAWLGINLLYQVERDRAGVITERFAARSAEEGLDRIAHIAAGVAGSASVDDTAIICTGTGEVTTRAHPLHLICGSSRAHSCVLDIPVCCKRTHRSGRIRLGQSYDVRLPAQLPLGRLQSSGCAGPVEWRR